MSSNVDQNVRPDYDAVIVEIADYVTNFQIESELALDTARNCLIDTIGCGLLALKFPACTKMLGPVVEGTSVPFGVRVPISMNPKPKYLKKLKFVFHAKTIEHLHQTTKEPQQIQLYI